MATTEVTNQSWFSRLGNSFKGIIAGLVLFLVGIGLTAWNEGRAVKTAKGLAEGSAAVISVEAASVDRGNEGKLIHLSGLVTTDETLRDDFFGVEVNALRLKREVEMLQWAEKSSSKTQNKLGGGTETVTTYTYEQTWSDKVIPSNGFKEADKHRNPASMPLESSTQTASGVALGGFQLGGSLLGRVGKFEALPPPAKLPQGYQVQGNTIYRSITPTTPPPQPAATIPNPLGSTPGTTPAPAPQPAATIPNPLGSSAGPNPTPAPQPVEPQPATIPNPLGSTPGATPAPAPQPAATIPNPLGSSAGPNPTPAPQPVATPPSSTPPNPLGSTPGTTPAQPPVSQPIAPPQIGDVRITFSAVKPTEVSIVAQQRGSRLEPFTTKTGTTIEMIANGVVPAADMFASAVASNKFMTWLLRLGGFIALYMGMSMVLAPLGVLADVLPILGSIMRFGTSLIALVIAIPTSLVTIAIAWVAYRPALGITLLVIGAGIPIALLIMKKGKTSAA